MVVRKEIGAPVSNIQNSKILPGAITDPEIKVLHPKSDISWFEKHNVEEKSLVAESFSGNHVRVPYDYKSKIDPFEPLFSEKPETKIKAPIYVNNPVNPGTELQKIDLSQLRLSGVILTAGGNKALVQEASGKGHVVSDGTSIGTHSGKITGILTDRIIVEELMEGAYGRRFLQKTELKIRKNQKIQRVAGGSIFKFN